MNLKQEQLKGLPQVDDILRELDTRALNSGLARDVILSMARQEISCLRDEILKSDSQQIISREDLKKRIVSAIESKADSFEKPNLKTVINATGVVLHTNFGRSLLSKNAIKEIERTSCAYTNLEYDLEKGERGSRHSHIEKLITDLTGAESAMVVNNNAAATLLTLSAIAAGKEVVTSRGELIEIGGSFRIPDIMEQGGAILREVGTTNRTRAKDYVRAFKPDKTAAFLKVHTSNYKVIGFTQEVKLSELVELAHERNIPAIYDMGSGLFCDLSKYGIDEPVIPEVLKTGVDLLLCSGDKLLGGPQAGIIIGKKEYIDMLKAHPLARAFRVDKITIAALCSTLFEYFDVKNAVTQIPTLRMIAQSPDVLKQKAEELAALISEKTDFEVTVEECKDQIGGGSAPGQLLDGYIVQISKPGFKAEVAEEKLRTGKNPIVGRISKNKLGFSVRTLQEGDDILIVQAVERL